MAEKFKNVTISDKKYRIGKWHAQDATYMLIKTGSIIGPIIISGIQNIDPSKLNNLKPTDLDIKQIDFGSLFAQLGAITEEDFKYIQAKCLGVVDVEMKSGYQPVMHANGEFSVEELDDDPMAVMALMVHVLLHNLAGFIQGSGLTYLNAIQATSQSN